MSRNARKGEIGESGQKPPEGWKKFNCNYKRRSLQRRKVDENGEFNKNIKFDEKIWQKFAMGLANIQIGCQNWPRGHWRF